MLYTLDRELINYIPHQRNYDLWRNRLTDFEYNEITIELNKKIEGKSVVTAGWIPGADWTDTPFQCIYSKACNEDPELSGKCFGLFFWVVMMQREEAWAFGRYEKDGIPIESMTYFQIEI